MKPLNLACTLLTSLLISGPVFADDDCTDPVANWQPREILREQLEQHGLTVQRIKVDDGCYEVKGVDNNGNTFKAKYTPASLQIKELKIKFDTDGTVTDYLKPASGKNPQKSGKPDEKASITTTSEKNDE